MSDEAQAISSAISGAVSGVLVPWLNRRDAGYNHLWIVIVKTLTPGGQPKGRPYSIVAIMLQLIMTGNWYSHVINVVQLSQQLEDIYYIQNYHCVLMDL